MHSLAPHISELLHYNDCVIIPGFGGLVCHYQSATIHPTQHIFNPPCKGLAFNKNLSQNDGLLAHHISEAKGCEYNEAIRLISIQVQEMLFTLDQGKSVRLEGVGMFMPDIEKNLQFFPSSEVNYLPDAFGLSDFQSHAILRNGIREKQPDVFQVAIDNKDREKQIVKRKKIVRRTAVLGALMILAGACALPFLFPDSSLGKNQLGGYLGKSEASQSKYKSRQQPENASKVAEEVPQTAAEEVKNLDFLNDGSPDLIIDTRSYHKAKADTTRVSTVPEITTRETGIQQFEIIAGCFSQEVNAQRFVEQLKAEFPETAIIGKSATGLYRVSVGSFSNRQEAESTMEGSRAKLPQLWLLASN